MKRAAFIGLGVVALVALALAAASVGSVAVAVDPGDSGNEPGPSQSTGCTTNGDSNDSTSGESECQGGGGSGPGSDGIDVSLPDVGESTDSNASQPPAWQVAVSLALVVLGGVVVIYGLTRGESTKVDPDDEQWVPTSDGDNYDGVDFAADVEPDNDVYRAWLGLRHAADAEADRSPAAVADCAVQAGYPPSAVERLTDLFCAIRYGNRALTVECERRARQLAETLDIQLEGEP
jgi:threonine dehydrogenase-like Zn-dependent dehydrogenase